MLHAGALLHLGSVASVLGVATAVREAEIFERLLAADGGAEDGDDLWAQVVAVGKVEAERPFASSAIVAVTMAKRIQPLRNLLTPVSPRGDVTNDDAAHGWTIADGTYRPVSERA